jgi:long-chain fatty acid transport protein
MNFSQIKKILVLNERYSYLEPSSTSERYRTIMRGELMNKTLILVVLLLAAQLVFAGGIVTNSNQSVQFIRSMSRNASTEIDATYFNPAGLTQLSNGWHISLHNQTIFQEKAIDNSFPMLNDSEYIGDVKVPFFPNFYAVYKKSKLAISAGFGVNGGGGSADFATGLPAFEIPVSALPSMVPSLFAVSGYKADIAFNGSSAYYGFQANAAYEINDMFSVAVGGRYIYAANTYEGGINNIQINPTFGTAFDGSYMSAVGFFNAVGNAEGAAMVADVAVDAKQTGIGITPIIGLNVKPMQNLNVAVRYEANTALELENETKVDGSGLFPDGAKTQSDIPAVLSLGAAYKVTPALAASFSYTTYFDKDADWGGDEEFVDKNFFEWAAAVEYKLSGAFLLSLGYNQATTGVTAEYQSDITHSLSSKSVAGGAAWILNDAMALQFGISYTAYDEFEKEFSHPLLGTYTETYNRDTIVYAIGLDYHL